MLIQWLINILNEVWRSFSVFFIFIEARLQEDELVPQGEVAVVQQGRELFFYCCASFSCGKNCHKLPCFIYFLKSKMKKNLSGMVSLYSFLFSVPMLKKERKKKHSFGIDISCLR